MTHKGCSAPAGAFYNTITVALYADDLLPFLLSLSYYPLAGIKSQFLRDIFMSVQHTVY
jgi:hypothetical protein